MKDRKVEILLLASLTVCSAFYATVTMLYPQVFLVGGYMRKDEVVVREYTVSWGSLSIGCFIILILNMIQCAFVFYQNFLTWCQTNCFKVGCVAQNIGFVVWMALKYSECKWKSLMIKISGNMYWKNTVCVMSGCSPGLDCFWIDNPQLLITIAFLLGFATLFEIFFLVLYQRLTFKKTVMPTCCQLALMDNVTNPHLIIVVSSIEQLSQNQSDSSQPVDPPDQSNISINVDPDNISRE